MPSFVKVKNAQKNAEVSVSASSLPKARCCHCGKTFYVPGTLAPQRCSHCQGDTSEEAYDQKALQLLAEASAKEECLRLSERRIADLQEKVNRLSRWPLLRIFGRIYRRKLEVEAQAAEDVRGAIKHLRRELGDLALARYHAGRWHSLTMHPLKTERYALYATYLDDGRFALRHSKGDRLESSGVMGEFAVFEAVRKCAVAPDSPLFNAFLVPNIYLPKEVQRGGDALPWDQVDLVVMTKKAAFVVEAKRWRKVIAVGEGYGHILEGKPCSDESRPQLTKSSRPIQQNAWHAQAFHQVVPAFPFDRIYELLVFSDPVSFDNSANDGLGFVRNVAVGAILDGEDTFTAMMEEELSRIKEVVIAEEALRKLAKELLDVYGDTQHTRSDIQRQRAKRLYG